MPFDPVEQLIEDVAEAIIDRRRGAGAYQKEKQSRLEAGLSWPPFALNDIFLDSRVAVETILKVKT